MLSVNLTTRQAQEEWRMNKKNYKTCQNYMTEIFFSKSTQKRTDRKVFLILHIATNAPDSTFPVE